MSLHGVLLAGGGVRALSDAASLRNLGYRVVVTYTELERHAAHVLAADRAVCIGGARSLPARTRAEAILDAARISGVSAIHPGDDELACNADFAEAVQRLGFAFVGPAPQQIRAFRNRRVSSGGARENPDQGLPSEAGTSPRRISVLVFGNGKGDVVALGARECTLRANEQCLLFESPLWAIHAELERAVRESALNLAREIDYLTAGSVEFTCDQKTGLFRVCGCQPRLMAADRVIEMQTGLELMEWMMRAAVGESHDLPTPASAPARSAMLAQVRATDPLRGFRPSTGLVTNVSFPRDCEVHCVLQRGEHVNALDSSLVATVAVHASDRLAVTSALDEALRDSRIDGVETNLELLRACVARAQPGGIDVSPGALRDLSLRSNTVEVLEPGTFSIVVDYPGRLGYWHVGIPASGPMDDYSHRLANGIVGNRSTCACLEMTLTGPSLCFRSDSVVALTGARMRATVDGHGVEYYRPLSIKAGQVLALAAVDGCGARTYLAIRGGLDVAPYLGSRSTFTLGGFGGHCGRALRSGDVLHLGGTPPEREPRAVARPKELNPGSVWHVGVSYGPHAAPEFLTTRDVEVLFASDYIVHFNSNRTGVRLIGPKPEWARPDGGEAGLHPSNIHDVPYAPGAVDFTGDMPILLGPDGPSLGGFVCPAVVIASERWKLGQLRPGDRVRFVPVPADVGIESASAREESIRTLTFAANEPVCGTLCSPVLAERERLANPCNVVYRRCGDEHLLVEYGPMVLDLRLRLRVHALMCWLQESRLPGIIDLTPGIRSLQVHYDRGKTTEWQLLDVLQYAEAEIQNETLDQVPSRIVHLPLSWNDPQTRLAISKYMRSVRADAPWCPSNIEFIRRINGLRSESEVYDTVFAASYLVLGLGDVYLGAPVATPIDPRHRLVTTKYNPARTWTPENAVGIGGAYLCIYGMEGPGGYQFVGRTLQVYNRFRVTDVFSQDQPWLLRYFDQLRFFPVSAEELLDMRRDFLHGRCEIRIETARFSQREYQRFLDENAVSIASFQVRQRNAFEAERQRWLAAGHLGDAKELHAPTRSATNPAEEHSTATRPSHV